MVQNKALSHSVREHIDDDALLARWFACSKSAAQLKALAQQMKEAGPPGVFIVRDVKGKPTCLGIGYKTAQGELTGHLIVATQDGNHIRVKGSKEAAEVFENLSQLIDFYCTNESATFGIRLVQDEVVEGTAASVHIDTAPTELTHGLSDTEGSGTSIAARTALTGDMSDGSENLSDWDDDELESSTVPRMYQHGVTLQHALTTDEKFFRLDQIASEKSVLMDAIAAARTKLNDTIASKGAILNARTVEDERLHTLISRRLAAKQAFVKQTRVVQQIKLELLRMKKGIAVNEMKVEETEIQEELSRQSIENRKKNIRLLSTEHARAMSEVARGSSQILSIRERKQQAKDRLIKLLQALEALHEQRRSVDPEAPHPALLGDPNAGVSPVARAQTLLAQLVQAEEADVARAAVGQGKTATGGDDARQQQIGEGIKGDRAVLDTGDGGDVALGATDGGSGELDGFAPDDPDLGKTVAGERISQLASILPPHVVAAVQAHEAKRSFLQQQIDDIKRRRAVAQTHREKWQEHFASELAKRNALPQESMIMVPEDLDDCPRYFHGNIDKSTAEALLLANNGAATTGKYLVRTPDVVDSWCNVCRVVVSVVHKGRPTHHKVERTDTASEFFMFKKSTTCVDLESLVEYLGEKRVGWPVALTEFVACDDTTTTALPLPTVAPMRVTHSPTGTGGSVAPGVKKETVLQDHTDAERTTSGDTFEGFPANELETENGGNTFFHGDLSKNQVVEVLEANNGKDVSGKFLIWTQPNSGDAIILSVIYRNKVTHHRIEKATPESGGTRMYTVYKHNTQCSTLHDLVEYLRKPRSGWPVALTEGVVNTHEGVRSRAVDDVKHANARTMAQQPAMSAPSRNAAADADQQPPAALQSIPFEHGDEGHNVETATIPASLQSNVVNGLHGVTE